MTATDQGPLIFSQRAGRIQPTGWTPTDGDWCILIGSEDANKEDDIEIGDKFNDNIRIENKQSLGRNNRVRNRMPPICIYTARACNKLIVECILPGNINLIERT